MRSIAYRLQNVVNNYDLYTLGYLSFCMLTFLITLSMLGRLKRARAINDIKLVGVILPGRPESSRVQIRSSKTRLLVQKYLAAYSYCPVHYQWRDLGLRFWPRWIREGDCNDGQGTTGYMKKNGNDARENDVTRSCSFPPGMTCKPQKSSIKTILWWHCR